MAKFIPLQKNNTKVKRPISITLCVLFILLSSFSNSRLLDTKIKVVVIDAGHGGKDPGSISGGVKEKDVTLDIAKKLGALIKKDYPSIKVYYTRLSDSFIELSERGSIANRNNADLFISIHCNHSGNATAHGTETYVMGTHKNASNLEVAKRENSAILLEEDYKQSYDGFDPNSPEGHIIFTFYQNAFREQSIEFASKVEEYLGKRKKTNKSRGVKEAGFLVLWKTAMPSVLIESGFISNPDERKYLKSDSGKVEFANAVFSAFKDYKKSVEKE